MNNLLKISIMLLTGCFVSKAEETRFTTEKPIIEVREVSHVEGDKIELKNTDEIYKFYSADIKNWNSPVSDKSDIKKDEIELMRADEVSDHESQLDDPISDKSIESDRNEEVDDDDDTSTNVKNFNELLNQLSSPNSLINRFMSSASFFLKTLSPPILPYIKNTEIDIIYNTFDTFNKFVNFRQVLISNNRYIDDINSLYSYLFLICGPLKWIENHPRLIELPEDLRNVISNDKYIKAIIYLTHPNYKVGEEAYRQIEEYRESNPYDEREKIPMLGFSLEELREIPNKSKVQGIVYSLELENKFTIYFNEDNIL